MFPFPRPSRPVRRSTRRGAAHLSGARRLSLERCEERLALSRIPLAGEAATQSEDLPFWVYSSTIQTISTATTSSEGGYLSLTVGRYLGSSEAMNFGGKPVPQVRSPSPNSSGADFTFADESVKDNFTIKPPFDPWGNSERDLPQSNPQRSPGGIGSVGNGGPGTQALMPSTVIRGNVPDRTLPSDLRQGLGRSTAALQELNARDQLVVDQATTDGNQRSERSTEGLSNEADGRELLNKTGLDSANVNTPGYEQQAISQPIGDHSDGASPVSAFPQSASRIQPLPLAVGLESVERDLEFTSEGGPVDVAVAVQQTQQAQEDHVFAAVAAVIEEHGVVHTPSISNQLPLEGELARAMALEMVLDDDERTPAPGEHSQIDVEALSAPPEGVPVSSVDKSRESNQTSLLGSAPGPMVLRAAVGAALIAWQRVSRPDDEQEPPRRSRFGTAG